MSKITERNGNWRPIDGPTVNADSSSGSSTAPTAQGSLRRRDRMKAAEDFGGLTIGLGHEVRVDVEGRRRVSVTESTRNSADIDAGGQESRCDVVPEVMQANPFDAGALAYASEATRHGIWVARRPLHRRAVAAASRMF